MANRWHCVQAQSISAVAWATAELARQQFDSFCPFELTDKGAKPLFGSYFFVKFDVTRDRWRSVLGTRGVRSLLGLIGDAPNPLALGIVEDLQRRATLGEFDARTGKPGWKPIEQGTPIRYCQFDGIVKRDMKSRVQILYHAFGGQREAFVKRELLEVAA